MKIMVLDGHPDPARARFIHALADAYASAAAGAGHEVRRVDVCRLAFDLLSDKAEFESGEPVAAIRDVQSDLLWCNHVVLLYPLWLGDVPARLKGLLEQVFRPGFAFSPLRPDAFPKRLLAGRSARVVVTMGMPAFVYRWYYGAHSVKSLQRNILGLCGFGPVRSTLIGRIDALSRTQRAAHLAAMAALGRRAA